MVKKAPQRNYGQLKQILHVAIGEEYMSRLTEEDIKAIGDFLIDCTKACSL